MKTHRNPLKTHRKQPEFHRKVVRTHRKTLKIHRKKPEFHRKTLRKSLDGDPKFYLFPLSFQGLFRESSGI
jgi:hypothetical protein